VKKSTFPLVLVGFVLAIGTLLLAVPFHQKKPKSGQRVTGTVTEVAPEMRRTVSAVEGQIARMDELVRRVRVPTHLRKRGEPRWTPLTAHQQAVYRVLAVHYRESPVMVKVAACESTLKHVLPDGRLNVGPDGHDWGVLMVRKPVHEKDLRQLGINPADFAQNVAFATYLLGRDGLRPWVMSQRCWGTPDGVQFHFPRA
jgi:hypothetical protein